MGSDQIKANVEGLKAIGLSIFRKATHVWLTIVIANERRKHGDCHRAPDVGANGFDINHLKAWGHISMHPFGHPCAERDGGGWRQDCLHRTCRQQDIPPMQSGK